MFEITYDFTSNWYLCERENIVAVEKFSFQLRQTTTQATRARTKNVVLRLVSTGWTLWSTTIFVLGDARRWARSQKRIPRFRVPVRYFTCANILWEQWSSRLVGRIFPPWVRSVCTGSIRQILGTMLVCRRKYLVKCNCGYWINMLPSRNSASLIMLKMPRYQNNITYN